MITCGEYKKERAFATLQQTTIFYHIPVGYYNNIKEGESMKVDVEKVMALEKAGWKTEKIASEMHMDQTDVDKAISEYIEKKKAEEDSKVLLEKKGKEVVIAITSDKLEEIWKEAAAIGAKEALKTFEQERKREYSSRTDRRLRNTKLLLRNYHMLKEHAENSVFGRTQMEESALDILESMMSMYDNEVIIESIRRSATRTAVIVSHIDTMLGLYAVYCEKSSNKDIDMRRYEALWDMYMVENPLSVKEIAEKQNMSARNVYEDIKIATERLSALIFGVDGLNVH